MYASTGRSKGIDSSPIAESRSYFGFLPALSSTAVEWKFPNAVIERST